MCGVERGLSLMYFYGTVDPPAKPKRLGAEEGQMRRTCPPGTEKVYLPEFPWEDCVPEEETKQPTPGPPPPARAPEAPPEPPYKPAEPRAPGYRPPGKARFLKVDEATGDIVDPQTLAPVFTNDGIGVAGTVAMVGLSVGVVGLILYALGVFR
jgi:hypothetical protein